MSELLVDGPRRGARATIVLAHGAGAPMDSDFMNEMAMALATAKLRIVRFEFPYMARRRTTGKKPGPDRLPKLQDAFREITQAQLKGSRKPVFLGGKSMGGRIATTVADEFSLAGVVCLGYPFHPVGKPDNLRTEHLERLKTPTLIVQGERDTFGNATEVPNYKLSKKIKTVWLPDGDHSFKPRRQSGISYEENMQAAVDAIDKFVTRQL